MIHLNDNNLETLSAGMVLRVASCTALPAIMGRAELGVYDPIQCHLVLNYRFSAIST